MQNITVVGDLILDRYLIGDATKLNPEQPGVVIRVDKEEDRLGGAGAVAMLSTGFGARVTLAGVVGRDEPGKRLRQRFDAYDIEPHVWIDDRPTTWKQRIVTRGQLRPDRCDREVTTPISEDAERFLSSVPLGDILLISDYGKGVFNKGLLPKLVGRARDAGVPILVDPARSRCWSDYGQVKLIKANWAEATEAAGRRDACSLVTPRRLADQHRCHVIVTLGRHGMACAELEGATWHVPVEPGDVRDVCGAGDTVFAALGVAMLDGQSLRDACRFVAVAVACQIANLGISMVAGSSSAASRESNAGCRVERENDATRPCRHNEANCEMSSRIV